jgi:hypothetical protein
MSVVFMLPVSLSFSSSCVPYVASFSEFFVVLCNTEKLATYGTQDEEKNTQKLATHGTQDEEKNTQKLATHGTQDEEKNTQKLATHGCVPICCQFL